METTKVKNSQTMGRAGPGEERFAVARNADRQSDGQWPSHHQEAIYQHLTPSYESHLEEILSRSPQCLEHEGGIIPAHPGRTGY